MGGARGTSRRARRGPKAPAALGGTAAIGSGGRRARCRVCSWPRGGPSRASIHRSYANGAEHRSRHRPTCTIDRSGWAPRRWKLSGPVASIDGLRPDHASKSVDAVHRHGESDRLCALDLRADDPDHAPIAPRREGRPKVARVHGGVGLQVLVAAVADDALRGSPVERPAGALLRTGADHEGKQLRFGSEPAMGCPMARTGVPTGAGWVSVASGGPRRRARARSPRRRARLVDGDDPAALLRNHRLR